MKRPRLLGHRGARDKAPENTLASLRRGIADGAEGFEFDVRATADGHAVLLHDETVDRTTDGKGPLAAMTLERARTLDAGSRFGGAHAGERIPTLDEVLDEFLGRVALAMEMKETLPDPVLRALAERLRRAGHGALRDDRFVVGSFQAAAVARALELVPAAPRARILHRGEPVPDAVERDALGLWGIFARWESVDARFLGECRAAGLKCYAYTVNDPEHAGALAALGVDGVISDDPGRLWSALG
jgi:glycerophosphoryl diester phosphodiesterase